MDPAGNLIALRSSRLSWAGGLAAAGPEMLHDRADVGEHEQPLGVHSDGQVRRNIIFADNSFHPRGAAAAVLGDRRAAASTADHHCSGGHRVGDRLLGELNCRYL